jgi:hypothetical protein
MSHDDPADAIARLARALERIESLLPADREPDTAAYLAFRWRKRRYLGLERGDLEPVGHPALIPFEDLKHVDTQKEALRANTAQFVRRLPANNALLTGARGTGKSSLIRACLHAFAPEGLRLIEVDKRDLVDLADIVDRVAKRPERFIVFCDDLSFDANEAGYKELKAALDGCRSIRSGRTITSTSSGTGWRASGWMVRQSRQRTPRRCSSRCSAARAPAASRCSSPATGPGSSGSPLPPWPGYDGGAFRGGDRRDACAGRRGGGHPHSSGWPPAAGEPARGQAVRRLLGVSRWQARAGRDRGACARTRTA